MRFKFAPLAVAFLLCLLMPASSYAGYDEGIQALKNRDYVAALKHFSAAVDAGNLDANVALAKMYGSGKGVKKSYIKAFTLLTEAARGGSRVAQRELGALYLLPNTGLNLRSAEGIAWLQKAGDGGDAEALGALGGIYSGLSPVAGIKTDKILAHKYFQKAESAGWEAAKAMLFYLEKKMTKEQVEAASK